MQQGPSSSKCLEVSNIKSLLEDLQHLRDKWPRILSEARLVANQIGIKDEFPSKRNVKRKKFYDESTDDEESLMMKKVSRMRKLALNALFFNVILDFVIADLTARHTAANQINDLCSLCGNTETCQMKYYKQKLRNSYKYIALMYQMSLLRN